MTAALFKVDIAGGTRLREKYRPEEIQECLRLYHDAVERLTSENGAKGLIFQGDGAVSYFVGDDAVEKAIEAAFQIQEAIRTLPKYELHLRIAIGVDELPGQPDFGKIVSHQFNLAGHAEKVCPPDSVAITEEAFLALERRQDLAEKFQYFGTTVADRAAVFVAPRGRKKPAEMFVPESEDPYPVRAALLNYYRSPEFRLLHFRGVRQFDRVGAAVDLREAFVDLRGRATAERLPELFEIRPKGRRSKSLIEMELALPRFAEAGPRPLRETLRSSRRVILLGDPGSGKTTFLRWLTLVVCDGFRSSQRHLGFEIEGTPLFMRVGRLWSLFRERRDGDIIGSIAEYFKGVLPDACLSHVPLDLQEDRWIFLLDGMDEIPDPRDRPEAARMIERMATSIFPRSRFVITSRVVGYSSLNLPTSSTLLLAPLETEQAEDLARHFYTALLSRDRPDSEEKAKEEAGDLIHQLSSRETLSPFLSNPLLLTLAAIVHTQLGRLPRYRARLYDVACQTLVDAWAQIRRTGDPAPTRERIDYEMEGLRVLPPLALWFHRNKPGGLAARSEVVSQIARHLPKSVSDREFAATRFLDNLTQAGSLLVDRGNDQWAFAHQTFQEYLAAKALAVSETAVYKRELSEHLYDVRYAEVWRFVAGELSVIQQRSQAAAQFIRSIFNDSDAIQARLMRKNLLIAVGCLSDAVLADDALSEEIVDSLVDLILNQSVLPPSSEIDACVRRLRGTPDATYCGKRLRDTLMVTLEPAIRANEVDVLGQLGAKEFATEVFDLLTDSDSRIRWSAAFALGQFGSKEFAPKIATLLTHDDSKSRGSAVDALAEIGATEYAPQVAALLTDADSIVRASAADALGALRAREFAREIMVLLTDEDGMVRLRGALALGQLEAKEFVPEVVALLKHDDFGVRWNAGLALEELEAVEFASEVAALLVDDDAGIRGSAVDALGRLGVKEFASAVAGLLTDPDVSVRGSAVDALGQMRASEFASAVAVLLTQDDVEIQRDAIFVLGQLGAKEFAPEIAASLSHGSASVRASAAIALGQMGGEEFARPIAALLTDGDAPVRACAADALGQLRAKGFVRQIFSLLSDGDAHVRAKAADALVSLSISAAIPRISAVLRNETDLNAVDSLSRALWKLSFLPQQKKRGKVVEVSPARRVLKKRR